MKVTPKDFEKKSESKEKKELKEIFALWKSNSKTGSEYLNGKLSDGTKIVAFYNEIKKNTKEPDIRVYVQGNTTKEICSLWNNVSESKKEYYSGTDNENKRVVGFINKESNETNKQPYIRVYED